MQNLRKKNDVNGKKKEFEYQQQLIEQQANIKEKEIIIKIYETRQR